jgi:hypothetical protein
MRFFSIFFHTKNSFEHQLPGEEIVLVARRHWLNLLGPLVILFLFSFFPLIAHSFISGWSGYEKVEDLFFFVAIIYYFMIWNIAFYNILMHSLNTVIITNKRLIENEQKGLYRHVVNELEYDKIQDMTVKIFGFVASFMDYGDIEIQTAGAQNKILFNFMPRPHRLKEIIAGHVHKHS